MERDGSGRRTTGSNVNRIYRLFGCLFAILILGLVSATLHYVIQLWNNTSNSSTSPYDDTKSTEQFLRSLPLPVRFPGYFRTLEEQKRVELSLLNSSFFPASNGSEDGLVNTCSGVCHKPIDWTPIIASYAYHACCESNSYFESPKWVIDISGKNRTLAIFNGNKQYFLTENCVQVTGCTTCICQSTVAELLL